MNSKMPFSENENGPANLLYFTLDTSRSEPVFKRANILKSAALLWYEPEICEECHRLADEFFDAAQTVGRYAAALRLKLQEMCPYDGELPAFTYLLDRLDEQPLDVQIELLGSMPGKAPEGSDITFGEAYAEVTRFNQRFEQFLFRIRNRQYEASNGQTLAALKVERRPKEPAKSRFAKGDRTRPLEGQTRTSA
ncbi:MAG: hypothetical protein HS122_08665 [Opitutaceae bacterium]|nr:hypothetical protein [Opitutaceae bacterium]